ncbi:chymotrypsin-like elastase family member 2A [Rhipicephalus microplus]|uniref:chymotrypsin-like elastase family member 2A n=1 Tax=Rhipicephalus microplus TaxID=6941 RepID=UPI003F6A6598
MEVGWNVIIAVVTTAAWTSDDPMFGTAFVASRHYNGVTTSKENTAARWPWNVAIHTSSRFRPEQFCGGALISDQHILTAAHCVDEATLDGIRVHLGSWRRSVFDNGEIAVPVKEMCVHQNYTGHENDIAVLKLAHPVNFTTTVRPVCLPQSEEHLPTETEAYATGWTVRKVNEKHQDRRTLQALKMILMNEQHCTKYFDISLPENVLCASHIYGSLCEGDSGAPAVQFIHGHWFIQGVLSGGPLKCGDRTLPMVFTRVSDFVKGFIKPYLRAKTFNQKVQVCTLT